MAKSEEPETECWPPLLANERQVSGLFAVALSSVCPVSSPEHPIVRTVRGDEDDDVGSNGRVDFLASYGHREIALELKRCPISSLGDAGDKKGLKNQWLTVSKQSKQALLHMREDRGSYRRPISIGLLVVRISRKIGARQDIEAGRMSAAVALPEMARELKKAHKPDFLSYYVPPIEMQTTSDCVDGKTTYRVFPGVVFMAVVHGNTSPGLSPFVPFPACLGR